MLIESRMRSKTLVRFGERHGRNRKVEILYGVPVPTQRDPSPSPEDIQATKQLAQTGQLVQILLSDHVIIGNGSYFSMKAENLL